MLKSLDNSNGIQYYGGNDPSKMGGRIKKGQVAGGGSSSGSSGGNAAKKSAKIDLDLGSSADAAAFNKATAQRQSDALNRSFDAALSSTRGKGFGNR